MDRLPLRPLERLLRVRLGAIRDERTGDALAHQPEPPEIGTTSVVVEPNEGADGTLASPDRPDLPTLLRIDVRGASFLDPGQLYWRLRARYGDLFDIREYAAFSEVHRDAPLHWVAFAGSLGGPATPLAGTPELACRLGIDLPSARADATTAALTAEGGAGLHIQSWPEVRRTRLALTFGTPSLLTLGRLAEIARLAGGKTARPLGYTIEGDLTQTGGRDKVEHTL